MAAAALGAFTVVVVIPRLGVGNTVFVVPILEGVFAYFVTRRGLAVVDAFLSVAGPTVAWVSLWALLRVGSDAPHDWQVFIWVMWTALLTCSALVGAIAGSASSPRAA